MEKESPEHSESKTNYWPVFWIGIAYIIILGLFTYFFNYPI